jgi:hypothetical protein
MFSTLSAAGHVVLFLAIYPPSIGGHLNFPQFCSATMSKIAQFSH